jgi:hypothetical protein
MLVTFKRDPAPELLFRFMKYVIASCHPKIKRRFGSHSSMQYWQCIKSVKPEDIHIQASSQRNKLQIELQNDYNFLGILAKDEVLPHYQTHYPNIAANIHKGPPHYVTPDFELFNDTTCKEYHLLFINLVTQYQHFMDQIAALAKEGESFQDILDLTVKTGHALLTMVKGRAFYLYLSTIGSKLSSLLHKGSHIETDRLHDEERNDEECDAGVGPGTTLWDSIEANTVTTTLWKPFKSWIMLILVQLDAAVALCNFITKAELRDAEIDVKLVYSSLVSDKTILLEELLTEKQYIPEPIADPTTNAKLLDFIKTANTLKKQVELLGNFNKNFDKNWDPMHASEGNKLIQQVLDEARKEHEEDSDQRVDPVNKMVSHLSNEIIGLLSHPAQGQDANILAKFTDLEGQLKKRQAKYDLPFTEKTTFKGALHCEAALASILDKTTREGIRARLEKQKLAGGKKFKDDPLYDSLSQLLEETKVGFFSVQVVPMVNPCSIHDGRASRESLGYQNVAAQCAVVFLLIYRWMDQPPQSPTLSHQVFTTPSRAAPYQNGPQNCLWMP